MAGEHPDVIVISPQGVNARLTPDLPRDEAFERAGTQTEALRAAMVEFDRAVGSGLSLRWNQDAVFNGLARDYNGQQEGVLNVRFYERADASYDTSSAAGFPMAVTITPENMDTFIAAIRHAAAEARALRASSQETTIPQNQLGAFEAQVELLARSTLVRDTRTIAVAIPIARR